jgi:hypothetical protein
VDRNLYSQWHWIVFFLCPNWKTFLPALNAMEEERRPNAERWEIDAFSCQH